MYLLLVIIERIKFILVNRLSQCLAHSILITLVLGEVILPKWLGDLLSLRRTGEMTQNLSICVDRA